LIKFALGSKIKFFKFIGIILSIGSVGICIYAGLIVAALLGLEKANEWAGAYFLSSLLDCFLT
jgi:hypothetical protein